ncbi:MAG: nickel-binding protein [Candidatus Limnocylindria bacterium]
MDRHDVPELTARDVADGHLKDIEIQDRFGVEYLTYWHDANAGTAFCLARGPSREAVDAVHREGHGLVANQIIEVEDAMVQAFLGRVSEPPTSEPYAETAFRTILFTDIVGSTSLTQRLGDRGAMAVLRTHDRLVREALKANGGREVKHTGDGIMGSFNLVADAAAAAVRIQRDVAQDNESAEHQLSLKVGLAAGEPVTEAGDLFGAVVQLAARLCDHAEGDHVLCSSPVRDLSLGKRLTFTDRGDVALRGFDDPIRVYELLWVPAVAA